MKKRLISILLTVTMLLSLLPLTLSASAEPATADGADYASAADQTYLNLRQNFVNTSTDTLYPVMFGYKNGETTNLGNRVSFSTPSIWESSVVLYAFDTYAQTLDRSSARYAQVAHTIANTMNWFMDNLSNSVLTDVPSSQNIAQDDAGWDLCAYMLGYRYNTELGDAGHASKCLNAALGVYNNMYNTYYDNTDGLLWYTTSHEAKSMYAAAFLIGGWDLYQVTNNAGVYTKFLNVYNGVENQLRRSDGLYAMGKNADGTLQGGDGVYSINFGGSCTYINANMAMAVINTRLGYTQKAAETTNAILTYEATPTNVLINDRDAWNNTYFMGMWVREVLNAGIGGDAAFVTLFNTADSILREAVFSDGYYSAGWIGPKEPSSAGYPTNYPANACRNNWGRYSSDTTMIQGGSTPRQCMTSATTAHVILAAAAAERGEPEVDDGSFTFTGTGDWLDANVRPDNSKSYTISYDLHYPQVAAGTTANAWYDSTELCIRNESTDHYLKIGTQAYMNGGRFYQIYMTAQFWNGTNHTWSARPEQWSNAYTNCISNIRVVVNYDADAKTVSWTSINLDTGAVISTRTASEITITDAYSGCTSCQMRLYRNSNNITVSNCTLVYEAEPEMVKTPISFSGSGDWLNTSVTADNTKDYEIGYDLFLPKSVEGANSDTWYDDVALKIRNAAIDDYLYLRCQTYINGSGNYQFASAGQMNDGGNWQAQDFQWSADKNFAVFSVHITYNYDAANGTYTWTAVNNYTGEILQAPHTFTGTLTPEYAACDACELQFYRNDTRAEIKNAYIAYAPEPIYTPGDFGWSTDDDDFTGWTATDEANLCGSTNRVWKSLLTNAHGFTAEMDITPDGNTSSAAVKLLGVSIEFDARNGNGNQVFIKFNGSNVDWLSAADNQVHLTVTRTAGGSLNYTVEGKDNATTWTGTAAQSEYSAGLELKIFAGSAAFENISVECDETVTHNYVASGAVVQPTCTTAGYTPATCSVCGDTAQINATNALGHGFIYADMFDGLTHCLVCARCHLTIQESHVHTNGVCVCGAAEPTVEFESAYLTLNENIDVTFVATVPDGYTDAYVVFTMNGLSRTVTDYTVSDGKRLYTFAGVTPQHMADGIDATIYAVKDGVTVSDTIADYSITEYCENQLNRYPNDSEFVTLLSDLLTYGAATQTYTGYQTAALATAGLDLTPSIFSAIPAERVVLEGSKSTAADWDAATLALSNALAVRLFFNADSTSGLTVTVSLNGRTQTFSAADFVAAGDGEYYVEFRGIKATEFGDTLVGSFAMNGTAIGRTVSYSVNTYISGLQNTANANLQALVRALYNYGVSAANYSE